MIARPKTHARNVIVLPFFATGAKIFPLPLPQGVLAMLNSRNTVARSVTRVPKTTAQTVPLAPHVTWAGANGVHHPVGVFRRTRGHARFRQTVYQTKIVNAWNRNS